MIRSKIKKYPRKIFSFGKRIIKKYILSQGLINIHTSIYKNKPRKILPKKILTKKILIEPTISLHLYDLNLQLKR